MPVKAAAATIERARLPVAPQRNLVRLRLVTPQRRIGFLFNHDMLHQIAHTAPIIAELVRQSPDLRITVFTSSFAQAQAVRALLDSATLAQIEFVLLSTGPVMRVLDRIAGKALPFHRVATLWQNRAAFARLDALVVPETTSTLLKTRFGLSDLALIYLPHGAGDRSIGFRKVTRNFDYVLLSGRKVRDRMLAEGLITEAGHAIVGYPKFDTLGAPPARIFDNGKPTVLYNPHFDAYLSSWYRMGEQVLDYFANQDRYNLIFAPHVMMYRRKFHLSVEHARVGWVRPIAQKYRDCPHIHIDIGSSRSSDMSYTRQADIYLGDASSQVYEFLLTPKPCMFLNAHGAKWRGDANYAHWQLGDVLTDVGDLASALRRATIFSDAYQPEQEAAVAHTFSLDHMPSSRRAAAAITGFLATR